MQSGAIIPLFTKVDNFGDLLTATPQPRGCEGGNPSVVVDLGVDEKAREIRVRFRGSKLVQMWQAGMPILA